MTVEQVAKQLRLHPKTVLRYIRDGRLEATRIGKSYRIPQAAVTGFAGIGASTQPEGGAQTTCITDIPDMTVETAERIATFLQAAALTGDADTPPLHLQTVLDPRTRTLKVVMIGRPNDVGQLLEMIHTHLTGPR